MQQYRALAFWNVHCPLSTAHTHSNSRSFVGALLALLLWYIPHRDARIHSSHILFFYIDVKFHLTIRPAKTHSIRTLFFIDATVTERCRSSTAGHIDVGGRIKLANFPNEHSAFTDAAHRLCNYQFFQLKMFPHPSSPRSPVHVISQSKKRKRKKLVKKMRKIVRSRKKALIVWWKRKFIFFLSSGFNRDI